MVDNDFFDILIAKCLAGESTAAEAELLSEYVRENDDLAARFLAMKTIWDAAAPANAVEGIDPDAALARLMSAIADSDPDVSKSTPGTQSTLVASRPSRDVPGDTPGATPSHLRRWTVWLQRAAAILFLPLLALVAYLLMHHGETDLQLPAYSQEFTTLPGTRMHTFLPDSTEVWINGATTLLYTQGADSHERHVSLTGEAFFNVAHDEDHPFIVSAADVDVRAVGTEFNVCAYPTDSLASVTLTQGAVKVAGGSTDALMEPGHTFVYNKNSRSGHIFLGNTEKFEAWRDGRLMFRNEPLGNVYKRIGQVYGLEFKVDRKIRDVLLYATFEDASLERILSLIRKSTPLEYVALSEDNEDNPRIIKVIAQ